MPKAKSIDRLEYTRSRSIHLPETPIRKVEGYFDSSSGEFVLNDVPGVEICPMCGAEVIHESGCVRCVCGWSRC